MSNKLIKFELGESKGFSWDDQWKGTLEVMWNSGMPFFSGIMLAVTQNPLWLILFVVSAGLRLKIRRKGEGW